MTTRPIPEARALEGAEFAMLEAAVARLPERQRTVIKAHFGLAGEQLTLAEVGAALDVSPARARAIERSALHDLALDLEPLLVTD